MSGALSVMVLTVAAAVTYLVSLWRKPYWPCWWCGGNPRKKSRIWRRAYGLCGHCNETGRKIRWGAKHLLGRGK